MEKRLSYIVVGTFIITITIALFVFLFWLAKYGDKNVEHDYYHTYFQESVSGLNIESLVKLRGVEVGRVKKISINKNNSEEVEVLLEIKQGTPIKKDTYTVLDSQGITGLKYIELKGGYQESALLETSQDKIATIKSKKSIMSSLFDSSESITQKMENILDKVNILLSANNVENISKMIDDMSNTMLYVSENKQKIGKTLDELNKFLIHTKQMEKEMLPLFIKLGTMSDKAGNASDKTAEFFSGMSTELKKGEFNVADIVEQNIQILNEAAISIRNLSQKLEITVDELGDSPSDMIFKSNEKILGPGESHE